MGPYIIISFETCRFITYMALCISNILFKRKYKNVYVVLNMVLGITGTQ